MFFAESSGSSLARGRGKDNAETRSSQSFHGEFNLDEMQNRAVLWNLMIFLTVAANGSRFAASKRMSQSQSTVAVDGAERPLPRQGCKKQMHCNNKSALTKATDVS